MKKIKNTYVLLNTIPYEDSRSFVGCRRRTEWFFVALVAESLVQIELYRKVICCPYLYARLEWRATWQCYFMNEHLQVPQLGVFETFSEIFVHPHLRKIPTGKKLATFRRKICKNSRFRLFFVLYSISTKYFLTSNFK